MILTGTPALTVRWLFIPLCDDVMILSTINSIDLRWRVKGGEGEGERERGRKLERERERGKENERGRKRKRQWGNGVDCGCLRLWRGRGGLVRSVR